MDDPSTVERLVDQEIATAMCTGFIGQPVSEQKISQTIKASMAYYNYEVVSVKLENDSINFIIKPVKQKGLRWR